MSGEFINPNWHVALIHFPLGLLMAGILIELFSMVWTGYRVRAAGRWMILLGTLAALPTAMAGVYALRDVQLPGPVNPDLPWAEVVRQAAWSPEKWEFLTDHLLANVVAVTCFLLVVVIYLAASDLWRRRLYWPFLVILLVGLGFIGIGAWHGGEAVYRFGVGVNLPGATAGAPEGVTEGSVVGARPAAQTLARYFLAPLQLHTVLGSMVLPFALLGLALTIRRWHEPATTIYDPGHDAPVAVIRLFQRRYWYMGMVAGLLAALAGAWSLMGPVTGEALRANLEHLGSHMRLLLHLIAGVSIILLLLLLALTARSARDRGGLFTVLVVLLFSASAIQIWLGILMLYDSHAGSLFHFGA